MNRTIGANPPGSTSPMSQGLLARPGRILHVSGQVPRNDADGSSVGVGDFAAQAEHALDKVLAIVAEAGGGPEHIVMLRSYLVRREDIPTMAAVRKTRLVEPYPATTTVLVAGLANPDWLLEVEAVAILPDPDLEAPAC